MFNSRHVPSVAHQATTFGIWNLPTIPLALKAFDIHSVPLKNSKTLIMFTWVATLLCHPDEPLSFHKIKIILENRLEIGNKMRYNDLARRSFVLCVI